ncbi:MAG TPA: hypothetical protein VFL94_02415 [Actinomycetales bacterium]|nr:hypothetical protein [Actinomycetales bacterium]
MTLVRMTAAHLIRVRSGVVRWLEPRVDHGRTVDDRGDVPGWVLVTIMTAGLVAALWAVAGDLLTNAFSSAINETVGQP